MSSKERLVQLAEGVPEDLAMFAFYLLRNYLQTADEIADDKFCKMLLDQALANFDEDNLVDFDEACKIAGVQLH